MKTILLSLALSCGHLLALDIVGPPPERTMEWTIGYLTKIKFPIVDVEDVPVVKVLDFARRKEYPETYTVSLMVRDESRLEAVRFSLKKKEITLLELLGVIASRTDHDLLIQPGSVTLVPKTKPAGGGQDAAVKSQPADKEARQPAPANESK